MDDQQLGRALRAIRVARRLRQIDVATRAGVPREDEIRIEQGQLAGVPWGRVRAVAMALDATLSPEIRWRGADLDRLLSASHAALHEAIAGFLGTVPGWDQLGEVSHAVFGENGVIDILAWHAPTRSLLIIELKATLGDPQELVGVMRRRIRLARRFAGERGWNASTVSAWVVFTATRTNRRYVDRHAQLLRGRFPADGRQVRAWLAAPAGSIMGLSFWTDVAKGDRARVSATTRRVRPTRSERDAMVAKRSDVGTVRRKPHPMWQTSDQCDVCR